MVIALLIVITVLLLDIAANIYAVKFHVKSIDEKSPTPLATASKVHIDIKA